MNGWPETTCHIYHFRPPTQSRSTDTWLILLYGYRTPESRQNTDTTQTHTNMLPVHFQTSTQHTKKQLAVAGIMKPRNHPAFSAHPARQQHLILIARLQLTKLTYLKCVMRDVCNPCFRAPVAALQPTLQAAPGDIFHSNTCIPIFPHDAAVVIHYPWAGCEVRGKVGVQKRTALRVERSHLCTHRSSVRLRADGDFFQGHHFQCGRMDRSKYIARCACVRCEMWGKTTARFLKLYFNAFYLVKKKNEHEWKERWHIVMIFVWAGRQAGRQGGVSVSVANGRMWNRPPLNTHLHSLKDCRSKTSARHNTKHMGSRKICLEWKTKGPI